MEAILTAVAVLAESSPEPDDPWEQYRKPGDPDA